MCAFDFRIASTKLHRQPSCEHGKPASSQVELLLQYFTMRLNPPFHCRKSDRISLPDRPAHSSPSLLRLVLLVLGRLASMAAEFDPEAYLDAQLGNAAAAAAASAPKEEPENGAGGGEEKSEKKEGDRDRDGDRDRSDRDRDRGEKRDRRRSRSRSRSRDRRRSRSRDRRRRSRSRSRDRKRDSGGRRYDEYYTSRPTYPDRLPAEQSALPLGLPVSAAVW